MLAALWPILRGTAITVRQAIASYGLSGSFGGSRLDVWIESVGRRFLSAPYAMTLTNMFRKIGRLALTQIVLITAGTMFLVVVSLTKSTDLTVTNDLDRRGYDVRVAFEDDERGEHLIRLAQQVPGVVEAEVWYTTGASILTAGQSTREAGIGAVLNGIPAGSGMYKPADRNGPLAAARRPASAGY